MSRWAIKFRASEAGKANIEDEPRSGRPVSVTRENHQMEVNELIQNDCISYNNASPLG